MVTRTVADLADIGRGKTHAQLLSYRARGRSRYRNAPRLRQAAEEEESLLPGDILAAALTIIDQRHMDAESSSGCVAARGGCSRSELYRAFSGQAESVAPAIWTARLERSRRMLTLSPALDLSVAQIASSCGFLDPSNFNRMFRTRYGMTRREMRELDRARSENG